jgi:hypothetical protein
VRKKNDPDRRVEVLARGIARLEREAFLANDPQRAAMCRDELAALFEQATGRMEVVALAACIEELDRRETPS